MEKNCVLVPRASMTLIVTIVILFEIRSLMQLLLILLLLIVWDFKLRPGMHLATRSGCGVDWRCVGPLARPKSRAFSKLMSSKKTASLENLCSLSGEHILSRGAVA